MLERVLMVCVGNICRSPLGEALWNHHAAKLGRTAVAESAGLAAADGAAAHSLVKRMLTEHGVDLPGGPSRPLSLELLRQADLVLVMEHWQQRDIQRLAPFARGRVYTLGHWQGFEIPDPYNEPEAVFRSTYQLIDQGVRDWLAKLDFRETSS
jgi:protein-tyrosine phosphatase